MKISFFVPGVAKPKGTLISGVRKDGRRFQRSIDKGHSDWKARIAFAAKEAMGDQKPIEGPVRMRLTFYFVRPKNHFFTGKRADVIREDAPIAPAKGGKDVDKLARLAFDALTSICYLDDSQVSTAVLFKRWANEPGMKVKVMKDWL